MFRKFRMAILLLLCSSVLFLIPTSAHSGDTDSSGGHYNRSTGEYHYHHGYPAHQHIDGVCPYMSYTNSGSSGGTGNKYVDAVSAQMEADEAAWREENKYYLEMDHEELVKEYLSMKQSFETVKAQRDALYEDDEEKSIRDRIAEELTLDSLYNNALTNLDLANNEIDERSIEVAELKSRNTFLENKNETLQSQIDTYEDSYFSIGLAIGIVLFMVSLILAARNIHLKKQMLALREAQTK